jgi:putative tryptophan/tyrosine transport system substrate-binding protein
MNKRGTVLVLMALAAAPLAAMAQSKAKAPVVAVVWNAPLATVQGLEEHMLRGLRELGYGPGKTVILEFRSSDGDASRLPALVGDLVRRKVDVIVAPSNAVAKLAQSLTRTIPIVMVDVTNPVATGLIGSLEHPGGNITGTYTSEAALNAKRVELLRQLVPKLNQVSAFMTKGNSQAASLRGDADMTERALAVKVEIVEIEGPAELDRATAAAAKRGADGVLLLPAGGEPLLFANRRQLIEAAAKRGLPVAGGPNAAAMGAVIGYGSRSEEHYFRSASFIDRILKGEKPAGIPVEQPTTFDLVVNLKAASALGLKVPPALLKHASKVIE